MSIQDARIHTTRHGWALDSFIVLLPEGDADLRAQATLVEHELAERLKAPAATAQQPAHTSGYYGRARQSRVSRVSCHAPGRTAARRAQQVLAPVVTATDRAGLLHALAQVFARHEVNLLMAKIMTLGDRVEDVFIVDGAALERPRTQMQFERDILDALAGEEARQRAA